MPQHAHGSNTFCFESEHGSAGQRLAPEQLVVNLEQGTVEVWVPSTGITLEVSRHVDERGGGHAAQYAHSHPVGPPSIVSATTPEGAVTSSTIQPDTLWPGPICTGS